LAPFDDLVMQRVDVVGGFARYEGEVGLQLVDDGRVEFIVEERKDFAWVESQSWLSRDGI
jgi:hypothetical protein